MEPDSATDERQDRVISALEALSLRLAGMYRSALSALRSKPEPGCEGARIAMICHCMRELILNLSTALGDDIIERPKPSSGSIMSGLPDLIASHPELDLELDQDMVPVPKKVALQISLLVKAAIKEKGRNQRNFAILVTGGDDLGSPAIKQCKIAYDFFVDWAHLDRNHERGEALPSDDDLLAKIRVIEDVIEFRTTLFFENLHSIEDLLTEINALSEEEDG